MKVLLRMLAVLFTAFGAFLVYAVIHAMASAGGARVGVSIAYIAGAIVLFGLATLMWRHKPRAGQKRPEADTPHAA